MNSNPNTPVAGLVERLTAELCKDDHAYVRGVTGQRSRELAYSINASRSRIEQLEADKRAVEDVLDWAYDHEPQLIERMRYMIATISNPSPVKGTE